MKIWWDNWLYSFIVPPVRFQCNLTVCIVVTEVSSALFCCMCGSSVMLLRWEMSVYCYLTVICMYYIVISNIAYCHIAMNSHFCCGRVAKLPPSPHCDTVIVSTCLCANIFLYNEVKFVFLYIPRWSDLYRSVNFLLKIDKKRQYIHLVKCLHA